MVLSPSVLFCQQFSFHTKLIRCGRQVDQGNDKGREENGLDWVLGELPFKFHWRLAPFTCNGGGYTEGRDYLPFYAEGPGRLNVPRKMRGKLRGTLAI